MKQYLPLLLAVALAVISCDDDSSGNNTNNINNTNNTNSHCGNGIVDAGEECDRNGTITATCDEIVPGSTGVLSCNPDCSLNSSQCVTATCGNNVVDGDEECDGNATITDTCADVVPGSTGVLSCNNDCTYNSSQCETTTCGNGVVDTGEECDGNGTITDTCDDVVPGSTGVLSCNNDCTYNSSQCETTTCGNGVVDWNEECDGSNLNGMECGDLLPGYVGVLSCRNNCMFDVSGCDEPLCGDGMVQGTEECDGMDFDGLDCADYGNFSGGNLACTSSCTVDVTACLPVCNVEGFFSTCNIMGGADECCPENGMASDCTNFWSDGMGRCMQTCGIDDDCGWNYYCASEVMDHCYYKFCGDGAGGTPVNQGCTLGGNSGWCYPLWRAMDDMGICMQSGTLSHGDPCVSDPANPVDGVVGVNPAQQCDDGMCVTATGSINGTCVDYCDPLAAYSGSDSCPAGWNCLNTSDLDWDTASS
ncbi:hypothetical protein KJ865_05290, partial [Myxococcota bacterium]|nr:hypothetical protein [Myxococcota bacterium]